MKIFEDLGAEIEARWNAVDYDESKFPAIAAELLKRADLPAKISAWDVVEWALTQTILTEQRDLAARFGDPPITIFNAPRFHIDLYFWLEGTTALHQHAFCGAFQVLLGSSIHSWYDFEPHDKVSSMIEIGTLNLRLCELLSVGDVQPIDAGRSYIHGLFHLDQPSATIVVRTHKIGLFNPQYSYLKPYLAIDPFFEEPNTTKQLQCLALLFRAGQPDAETALRRWLMSADFYTVFQILLMIRPQFRGSSLDRMFHVGTTRDRFSELFDVVRERHGERANVLPAVFAYQDKLEEILEIRRSVTDPAQRFFLALLMNLDDRASVCSLVRERFPDADPLEKILDWIYELSQTRIVGQSAQNALGLDRFDDLDLAIVEELIHGKSADTVRHEFAATYGEARLADFPARVAQLRAAPILATLLSGN